MTIFQAIFKKIQEAIGWDPVEDALKFVNSGNNSIQDVEKKIRDLSQIPDPRVTEYLCQLCENHDSFDRMPVIQRRTARLNEVFPQLLHQHIQIASGACLNVVVRRWREQTLQSTFISESGRQEFTPFVRVELSAIKARYADWRTSDRSSNDLKDDELEESGFKNWIASLEKMIERLQRGK